MKKETHLMIWLRILQESKTQAETKFAIEGLENALATMDKQEREEMEKKLNINRSAYLN